MTWADAGVAKGKKKLSLWLSRNTQVQNWVWQEAVSRRAANHFSEDPISFYLSAQTQLTPPSSSAHPSSNLIQFFLPQSLCLSNQQILHM